MSIIMISCSYPVLSSIAPVTCTSLVIYLLICSCPRLGFQCMIMIRFYGYTCAYPGSPLGFASLLAWGVSSDSPGFSCPGSGAWSLWILPVTDQRRSGSVDLLQTIWSSILPGPCVPLEFPCSELVSAFLLLPLYISCSLAFAPIR